MLSKQSIINILFFAFLAAMIIPAYAFAASPLGIGTAEPSFQTTGLFGGFLSIINAQQQAFYRALTGALKAMRTDPWALSSLVGLSFAYGVFHAAGPGHGKAVISSYMIANETELKRGIVISFASSFMQGGVAILLVSAAWLVLRGTSVSLTDATNMFELLSYAAIVAFGCWLLFRKTRSLMRPSPVVMAPASVALAGGPPVEMEFRHNHDHSLGHATHNHAAHSHAEGVVCSSCGHVHAPSPETLKGSSFNIRQAWSAIVAVGLRPCSGALLVLTFSLLNGLYLGGFLSVIAMSFGTALTVSLLATMAVTAKDLAVRYAGATGAWIGNAIEIFGALLVIALGATLLLAALQG
jgi:nickel/cobalt transporter (NicO) family protein